MEKWQFSDQNQGSTRFEKCQFFDFLNFLFFTLPKNKKLEKWQFLDQKHGLTPLENCPFFDISTSGFLLPRKAFFRFGISQKTFSWPILPKKKKLEKWPFLDQNHGLTPFEECQFLVFLNFLFL